MISGALFYAGDSIVSTSSQQKLTNFEDGARLFEVDTKIIYILSGNNWIPFASGVNIPSLPLTSGAGTPNQLTYFISTSGLASTNITGAGNVTVFANYPVLTISGNTGAYSTFASTTNLISTGVTLHNEITSLSGNLNLSGTHLINHANNISGQLIGLSGKLDSTGTILHSEIVGLSGVLNGYSKITNAVTGNGTPTYIPLWASTSGLTNSIVYQSGGNIGVDFTTPVDKLEVGGNIKVTSPSYAIRTNYVTDQGNNYTPINVTNPNIVLTPNTAGNVQILGGLNVSGDVGITGQVKILGGNPAAGRILVSDANGLASWYQVPTGLNTLSGDLITTGNNLYNYITGLSGVLNLANYRATSITSFGDSITVGYGLNSGESYIQQIETIAGWSINNLAVNAAELPDIGRVQSMAVQPDSNDTFILLPGFNDHRHIGSSSAAQRHYETSLRGVSAWLSIPSGLKYWASNSNIIKSGTWVSATPYSPQFTTSSSYYSTTLNDTIEFTFWGTSLYVAYPLFPGNPGGTFNVIVDNVLVGTIDQSDGIIPVSAVAYWPACKRFAGFDNAPHAAQLTVAINGRSTFLDWIAGSSRRDVNQPRLICGGVLRMTTGGYAIGSPTWNNANNTTTALYCEINKRVIEELAFDGYSAHYAPVSESYVPDDNEVQSDQIHPNAVGALAIAKGFCRTIDQADRPEFIPDFEVPVTTPALAIAGADPDLDYPFKIGTGQVFRIKSDLGTIGELNAGVLIGTESADLNLISSVGTVGKAVRIGYFNGTAWYSAAEVANVSNGYSTLYLIKTGGTLQIGQTNGLQIIPNAASVGDLGLGVRMGSINGDVNLIAAAGNVGNAVRIGYFTNSSWESAVEILNTTSGIMGTLTLMKDGGNVNVGGEMIIDGALKINNIPGASDTQFLTVDVGGNVRQRTGGDSGTSGTSGNAGAAGTSGTSGANGAAGSSGTAGTSGVSGNAGVAGTSGTSGANGAAGSSGTAGTSGVSGNAGVNGTSGTSGANGATGDTGAAGTAGTSGTSGTNGSTSDFRVKRDIKSFSDGLNAIEKLDLIKFKYNGLAETINDNKEYIGFIAQYQKDNLPYCVYEEKRKLNPTDKQEEDIYCVKSEPLIFVLVNAVKELSADLKKTKREIAYLKQQLNKK